MEGPPFYLRALTAATRARASCFPRRRLTAARSLGPSRLARRGGSCRGTAFFRRRFRLFRQCRPRRGAATFALQRTLDGTRALGRCLLARMFAARRVPRRFFAGFLALTFSGGRQTHTRSPRLRKSDGDRLLGVACAVLPFANVVDFLANELAGLRRRRLAFALVLVRGLQGFFLRHRLLLREWILGVCAKCMPTARHESCTLGYEAGVTQKAARRCKRCNATSQFMQHEKRAAVSVVASFAR